MLNGGSVHPLNQYRDPIVINLQTKVSTHKPHKYDRYHSSMKKKKNQSAQRGGGRPAHLSSFNTLNYLKTKPLNRTPNKKKMK